MTTMNVFFIIGNTAITPNLDEGTILAGVTRNSTMVLLQEMGFKVEERALSIDDSKAKSVFAPIFLETRFSIFA